MVFEETQQPDPPHPDDFAPAPPKPLGPLNRLPGRAAAWPAILCFAFFFIASYAYWFLPEGGLLWVSRDTIFQQKEYWRLFTALFTHADIVHILSNAPLFLIFGWFLRAFFGFAVFPMFTLLLGALANLVTIWFYEPATRLVGASGMVYAMVGLWLVLYIRFDTDQKLTMRCMRAIAFALVVMAPTTFRPEVSYLAHGAGITLGLLAGFTLSFFVNVSPTHPGIGTPESGPLSPYR